MTTWNKKWDICSNDTGTTENFDVKNMKAKISNVLKRRHENPKKIIEFEDIYRRPQSSNIIEGLETQNDDDNSDQDANEQDITQDTPDDTIAKTKEDLSNFGSNMKKSVSSVPNPITSLENDLSNTFDGLSNLGDFDLNFGDMFSDENKTSVVSGTDFTEKLEGATKNIESVATEVSSSMLTISQLVTNVLLKIGGYLNAIKLSIMLFMLQANRYIKTLITNVANALTQDTATEEEITTFQDQVQKFISILLTWFFVYNWYYIVFFLEDEDNMRYTFEVDEIKNSSKVLYGLVGPACHVLERFNSLIIGTGNKIKEWKVPNAVIMFGMFLLFYSLVQMNFQTSLLSTFFNAMRGKYGTSLISMSTIAIVGYYGIQFMFGKSADGYMEIQHSVVNSNGFFMMCFFLVIMILYIMAYSMWIVAVNVPLGVLLVSTYLTLYSFMGVFVYERFNCFNIITGISDSIDTIVPDLTTEVCQPDITDFSEWPRMIGDWCGRMINYASTNMFEILILLSLLGGIGVYSKTWSTAGAGKVGISSSPTFNIQQSFKHLFTWLILINILLIIIMCMYLYKKIKTISDLQTGSDGITDNFKSDQTMRSRMAGLNNSLTSDGPVMKESKVAARQTENEIPPIVEQLNVNAIPGAAGGPTGASPGAAAAGGPTGASPAAGSGGPAAATPPVAGTPPAAGSGGPAAGSGSTAMDAKENNRSRGTGTGKGVVGSALGTAHAASMMRFW